MINALPGKLRNDFSTPNQVGKKEVQTHDPPSISTDIHACESGKPASTSMRIPYFRGILREQVHMTTQQYPHDYSDKEYSGRLPMLESWCAWKSIYATELETDTDQMSNDLFGRFGQVDLSRIPPKVMISDVRAMDALRAEIQGILQSNEKGVPIGRIVALNSLEVHKAERLHTTVVTKIKPGKGFKCRLCVRGANRVMRESLSHQHRQWGGSMFVWWHF